MKCNLLTEILWAATYQHPYRVHLQKLAQFIHIHKTPAKNQTIRTLIYLLLFAFSLDLRPPS